LSSRIFLAVLIAGVSTQGWSQASNSPLEAIPADRISDALNAAPLREGSPPTTPDGIPHQQHDQNAPLAMQQRLMAAIFTLPGILVVPTPFSLPGSQGWRLVGDFARGPEDAFLSNESLEFGHLHRPSDGSMHMLLPMAFSTMALEKGWGIIHPLSDQISGEISTYVMIYGPRNEEELRTIWIIAQVSYYFARGVSMESSTAITPASLGEIKTRVR
jgi:hypothetical protein